MRAQNTHVRRLYYVHVRIVKSVGRDPNPAAQHLGHSWQAASGQSSRAPKRRVLAPQRGAFGAFMVPSLLWMDPKTRTRAYSSQYSVCESIDEAYRMFGVRPEDFSQRLFPKELAA